jgi:hypothetical protein
LPKERKYMNDIIYLVWNPCGTNPSKRHNSAEDARAEARRLCQLNPGQEFFVLRAIESVQYRTDPFVCKNFSKSGKEMR